MNAETEGKILLLANDAETYGVSLDLVMEIRAYQAPTRLPHAQPGLLGIINVGGRILQVIDLRRRLWDVPTIPTERHVIVIVRQADMSYGLLVDRATEIATFAVNETPLPETGNCFREIAYLPVGGDENPIAVAILDIEKIIKFEQAASTTPATDNHGDLFYDQ